MGCHYCAVCLWTVSCRCACLVKPLQASFPFLCISVIEMHLPAVTQHVPVLSDLVSHSADCIMGIYNFIRKVGWVPLQLQPVWSTAFQAVLTQFRLDSSSFLDADLLADPYHGQNNDLCPLFHPV